MDHDEAVRAYATERYLLGELTATERERFERHALECRECAEDVRAAATFLANAERLLPPAVPATPSTERRPRARLGRLFWPVPVGVAASLVLLIGLAAHQALIVVPRLRGELAEAEKPQAAPSHFLSVSRADAPVFPLSKRYRTLGLTLSRSSELSFAHYRCELREVEGRTVQSAVVPGPPEGEELQILLPTSRLRPGVYEIVLAGLDSPGGPVAVPDLARYRFALRAKE